MKADIPQTIMVKITVNDELAATLREAGFNHRQQTRQQFEAKEARHEDAANKRGVDPMRFASEGRKIVDSGTPVFGKQGQNKVSLKHTINDIVGQFPDYSLVGLNVQTKTDGKHVMWQVFKAPADGQNKVEPSGAEKFHINAMMNRIYGHCHVWRNPIEGTITINVGAPMDEKTPGAKDLRIYEQALSIRCVDR